MLAPWVVMGTYEFDGKFFRLRIDDVLPYRVACAPTCVGPSLTDLPHFA